MKAGIKKVVISAIPSFIRNWIIHDWKLEQGMASSYHISYSQQAEDLHIERFFQGKQNGFFVDVGAFHPVLLSNTNKFYRSGWHGINIEPNPDQFDAFKQLRPRDVNLNIAIGEKGQTLIYHKFNQPALNSFSTGNVNDWANRPGFNLLKPFP